MAYLISIVDFFAVLLFLVTVRGIRDHRRRGGLPYPPGPRSLPIIGNLLDIPKEYSWLAYTQFSKTHGDILSFHVLGQVIVVLNTAKAAKDLLEKRGNVYPDRPPVPFMEMMEWHWNLSTARSDDRWRLARGLLERGLRPGAAASYRPLIQAKAHVLLSRLLAKPNQWEAHIELFGSERFLPGALLVNDFLSVFRHIPEWLPWFSYKPLARLYLSQNGSFQRCGTAVPSLALENLQEVENLKLSGPEREKAEERIAGALGSIYVAGADTTFSAMMWFVVAMLVYPDLQKTAQAELDSVIGRERLPTFQDRPRLPFIEAVCKEVLRWQPVTPVGVPHAAIRDDVYAGYFIPKAYAYFSRCCGYWKYMVGYILYTFTMASTLSRAILRDPALYPRPDIFKPERFLNPDGSLRDDPILASAFGFGKRICPGRHVVDATLFISVASLFSVFNIEKVGDGNCPQSFRPDPFPCSFVPRDEKARELILADFLAR
ncbi:cytochrome P450 [Russula brevipes]|nr:cytochrome P450 [Russula brevipes]